MPTPDEVGSIQYCPDGEPSGTSTQLEYKEPEKQTKDSEVFEHVTSFSQSDYDGIGLLVVLPKFNGLG